MYKSTKQFNETQIMYIFYLRIILKVSHPYGSTFGIVASRIVFLESLPAPNILVAIGVPQKANRIVQAEVDMCLGRHIATRKHLEMVGNPRYQGQKPQRYRQCEQANYESFMSIIVIEADNIHFQQQHLGN